MTDTPQDDRPAPTPANPDTPVPGVEPDEANEGAAEADDIEDEEDREPMNAGYYDDGDKDEGGA